MKMKKKGALPLCMAVAAILISAALISCAEKPAEGIRAEAVNAPEAAATESGPEESPAGRLQEEQEAFAIRTKGAAGEVAASQTNSSIEETRDEHLVDPGANQASREATKAELDRIAAQIDYADKEYPGGEMLWPAPGHYEILSAFGSRFDGSDFHTGMDICGHEDCYGEPVIAAQGGTVAFVNTAYTSGVGYGMYIILDHGDRLSTLYGHLSAIDVRAGDSVEMGQVIGQVGATGWAAEPHLHFEVREEGKPVEPSQYLVSR